MKKYLAIILAAMMIFTLAPGVAMADQTENENGSEVIRETLSELLKEGNPDASVTVAEGLASSEEAEAFIGDQTDDVMSHLKISCEMTAEEGAVYSVTVYAKEFWNPEDESSESLSTLSDESLSECLRAGWDRLSEYINVGTYGLTEDNVVESYFEAILDNPDCFNVYTKLGWSYNSKGIILGIVPSYITSDSARYVEMKADFNTALAEAKTEVVNSGATSSLDKVYVLHNWLCERADYNYDELKATEETTDWTNYTAYGTLVNKKGVCQSYTLAYATLLEDNGVDVASLLVQEMNHAWNEVKVGGAWYQVDATWDDTGNTSWPVRYSYFMKSDSEFEGTYAEGKHYGWKNGTKATSPAYGWDESLACTSALYDESDWTEYEIGKTPEVCVHNLTKIAYKAATCTEDGNIAYWKCSECNKIFSNEAATEETTLADITIKASGHTAVTDAAKAATCTETGLTEGSHCSVCGTVITAQKTIAKLGHNYETVSGSAKEASCTEAGKEADQKCSRCGDVIEGETIAKLGHNYETVSGSAKEASCTEAGKEADQKCSRCGDVIEGETIAKLGHDYETVSDSAKEASCTEAGKEADQKCSRCGDVIEGETIAKLGHNYETVSGSAKEATCTEAGKEADQKCSRCGNVIEGKTISALGHKLTKTAAKAAKCIETGNPEYWTCSTCHKLFSDDKGTTETTLAAITIAALGHDYKDVAGTETAATCTKAGKEADQKCSRCGDVIEGKTIAKLDHTVLTDAAKEPTCTETGLTEGSHCSVCGTVITAQKTIPALGHNYETVSGSDSKSTLKGSGKEADKKCSRCGDVIEGKEIAQIKSVPLSATSKVYTGKAQKPSVTVKDTAGNTLKLNTDYTVSYSGDCKTVGSYTVTVTFKGNYSGSKKLTYKITKASQSLTVKSATKTVTYSKVKKANQVAAPVTVSGAKTTVTYKLNKYVTSKAKKYLTLNTKTGKVTVKKGTPKGIYKIQVKVTAAADTNYKAASKTVTATIVVK